MGPGKVVSPPYTGVTRIKNWRHCRGVVMGVRFLQGRETCREVLRQDRKSGRPPGLFPSCALPRDEYRKLRDMFVSAALARRGRSGMSGREPASLVLRL